MLANNEDKNLLRENTRLNFLSSLQTLLLPALLSLQSTLRAFRQAVNGQAVKASVQSFLFAVPCSSLVSYAPRMQLPSGMNLLWSGLIHSPHSLFGAMPAAAWAHPAPTVPLGCACPTIEQLLLSISLFVPLFPLPSVLLSNLKYVFTEVPQTPPDGFGNRCVHCKVWHRAALNSSHRGHPCSHLCHQNLVLYRIQKLAITDLLLTCKNLE